MLLPDTHTTVCTLFVNREVPTRNTREKAITKPISRAGEHNSLVFAVKAVKKGRRPQTLQTLSQALTFFITLLSMEL
jgi:hypothetical protein